MPKTNAGTWFKEANGSFFKVIPQLSDGVISNLTKSCNITRANPSNCTLTENRTLCVQVTEPIFITDAIDVSYCSKSNEKTFQCMRDFFCSSNDGKGFTIALVSMLGLVVLSLIAALIYKYSKRCEKPEEEDKATFIL